MSSKLSSIVLSFPAGLFGVSSFVGNKPFGEPTPPSPAGKVKVGFGQIASDEEILVCEPTPVRLAHGNVDS